METNTEQGMRKDKNTGPLGKVMLHIKNFRFTPKEKRTWAIILIALSIVTILSGLYGFAYKAGYSKGKIAGKASAPNRNSLGNIPSPFKSISGTVVNVNEDKLTILTVKNEKKIVKITDKTKATQKATSVNVAELKKDQKITVFIQGEGSETSATRIVLRD